MKFTKACESELFYTQVLKIVLDGNEEKVVLKELQREPEKGKLLHADFQRVSSKTKLKVTVPVKFINEEECHGVKMEGGALTKAIREIEISCLASNIPESIDVDVLELKLNESIRLTELSLGEGVEIPNLDESNDQMVVNVITLRKLLKKSLSLKMRLKVKLKVKMLQLIKLTQHQKMRQLKAKILLKKHQLNNWYKLKKSFF